MKILSRLTKPRDAKDTSKRVFFAGTGLALVVVGFILIPTIAMTAIGIFLVPLGLILCFAGFRGK